MSNNLVDRARDVGIRLCSRHEGETIEYASCPNNGCFDMCVLKQHVKNGRVTAIETDDSIHVGMGREDEYCDWKDIQEGMYQKRACVRGRGQRSDTYSPTRIMYPMRRIGPKPSYEFERITWDEALDEIAKLVLDTREKYGPLSVWGDGMQGQTWDHLGAYLPGGAISTWGEDSFEPTNTADWFNYGYTNQNCFGIDGLSENQTFFDSKLIILIGFDAAINYPETVYYLLMAKEKGVPIITIDPRFTWTAEAIGTQHIFIRPGTDLALILAMSYVLLDEEIYDKKFCDEWVEPKGFALWRDYILGSQENGEAPKSPEWAEGICGIPAETIRDLAHLYAKSSPCYIRMVWAAARQLYGKQAARGLNCLQALGGNIGHNGCAGSGVGFSMSHHLMAPYLGPYLGETDAGTSTCCMEAEMWHKAILLHEKLEAGEITEEYYKGEIGCPKNTPAPNIHLMFCINSARNHLSGWYGANERREALLKVDHMVYAHWNLKSPQIPYSDIVIPVSSPFLEGVNQIPSSPHFGSFTQGINAGIQNSFMYGRGGGDPVGETRPMSWIIKQLSIRMGISDKIMPVIPDDTPWNEYPDFMEEVSKGAYNTWKEMDAPYGGAALPDLPEWDEFRKKPIYRVPMKDYHVFARQHIEGGAPFPTKSGKIEFYSDWIAENDLTAAVLPPEGGLKCFGNGDLPPMALYKHTPEGMLSPKTKDYPLYMVTPHSFYRHHCAYDHSLWYRDEFRNSVWMSVADAKARGIKDGDQVHVFSTAGECLLTAYVTSRMTPGVCCIIFGRWYEPNGMKTDLMPGGIDTNGDCNMLIPSEFYDDVRGALLCNALVEIEAADSKLHLDQLLEVK